MLTLKHFLDRPVWAAAAGYDFNYMDCLSYTACRYDQIFSALRDVMVEFPETPVKELPLMLLVVIAACAGVVVWPFIFWIVGIAVWFGCKKYQWKYRQHTPERVRENLAIWLRECEKKWTREARCF